MLCPQSKWYHFGKSQHCFHLVNTVDLPARTEPVPASLKDCQRPFIAWVSSQERTEECCRCAEIRRTMLQVRKLR